MEAAAHRYGEFPMGQDSAARVIRALTVLLLLAPTAGVVRSQQPVSLAGHKDSVFGLAISADGTTLASASADGRAILWDLAAKQPRLTFARHESPVYCVALAP